MPRHAHAVLGGTFDRLHVGHAALLAAAFRAGRRVSVGLTTDEFVRRLGKPRDASIEPYATRRRNLTRWIARRFPGRAVRVVPLADTFGRSVEPGVGVLVVSAETRGGGRAVNAERRRRGHPAVPVVIVPLVLAEDLRPVSSRRIRAGEIDRLGHRIAPLAVGIATADAEDRAAAIDAVLRALPSARVRGLNGPPGRRGGTSAQARALAGRAVEGRDLGLGIVRRAKGGWVAVERSPVVALDPREIRGTTPRDLERGIERLVRPGRPQSL